jgi:hypothetical protein
MKGKRHATAPRGRRKSESVAARRVLPGGAKGKGNVAGGAPARGAGLGSSSMAGKDAADPLEKHAR